MARRTTTSLGLLAVLLAAPDAGAVIVAAPGFAVRTIAVPDTVQGGIVRRGKAILVGQGPAFTAGAQSIVRIENGTATTIATGFNSLGGMTLDAGGTLWVTDNGLAATGAVTGGTLFAIPDALTRDTAVAAVGAEVLPAGTIPAAQDVRIAGDGAALVANAAGPGAGGILRVAGGTATAFATGLDFLGGLDFALDGSLRVANLDGSFTGNVLRFAADGTPLGPLATGLSGSFDVVADDRGDVLVSGGFTGDFSSSTVVAIAPDGTVTERARGFLFSTEMFFDAARGELLVLDVGVAEIVAICRDRDGDGVCDADDVCPTVADDQTDSDGDGTGDACACDGTGIARAKLALRGFGHGPADDSLRFSGEGLLPADPPLDPRATGLRVLLHDGAGDPMLDLTLPAGAFDRATGAGWKKRRSGTWTLRWETHGPAGRVRALVRVPDGNPGLLRFWIRTRGGTLPFPSHAPLQGAIELDAAAGQCGETDFGAADCRLSGPAGRALCR